MDRVALLPLFARWWWVLLLATLVAGAAGLIAVSQVPKTYRADAQTLVGPINTDISLDASGALASTYAELAKSQNVLDWAIKETGSELTTLELDETTTAISNQVTRIVSITVESRDPKRAAELANALARRLSFLSTKEEDSSASVLKAFRSQPEYKSLERPLQNSVDRAAKRVFGPSAAGRLTVTDPARPPEDPAKPIVPLVVALAAIGGLLIAAIVVLIKESRHVPRRDFSQPGAATVKT